MVWKWKVKIPIKKRMKQTLKEEKKNWRWRIAENRLGIWKRREDGDLKIVGLDISPNEFEGLGSGNLLSADEGCHFRGDITGFHDATDFAGSLVGLRDLARDNGSNHAQWRSRSRTRRPREAQRVGLWKENGGRQEPERQRHSHSHSHTIYPHTNTETNKIIHSHTFYTSSPSPISPSIYQNTLPFQIFTNNLYIYYILYINTYRIQR